LSFELIIRDSDLPTADALERRIDAYINNSKAGTNDTRPL